MAPDEPALTCDEQINTVIMEEMDSERATPMSIFAPSPAPPSPVTKAVFSQQDILDTANLLLRNPMRFSNSLSDHAPAMLLASGALPENTVLTIGESAGMGGVRILRRNQDSVTEPHARELHLDLILVPNEGLPSVQYFSSDRKGNMIEPRGNPEECFYRAVSGALRLRGHTGPASVLRNAVADEFLAHPHVWLNYVDLDSLFDELQQVRERLAHHPLGT